VVVVAVFPVANLELVDKLAFILVIRTLMQTFVPRGLYAEVEHVLPYSIVIIQQSFGGPNQIEFRRKLRPFFLLSPP